ncbi:MAG TPA: hypothetical protein VIX86_04605 [Streptosporangiaceae bacterium]
MATYVRLPPFKSVAALDTTGANAGNWTNAITANLIAINAPFFELSHIALTSAPVGAAVSLNINNQWFYGGTSIGVGGVIEYDPSNPPILIPGQDIYLFWNVAASGIPPVAHCHFRADIDIPANRQTLLGVG